MCNLFYLFIIAPQSSPTTLCPPRQMWPNVRCQYRVRPLPPCLSIRVQLSRYAIVNCTRYVRGIAPHRARPVTSVPSTPCRTLRGHSVCDCTPMVPGMGLKQVPLPRHDRIPSTKIRMSCESLQRYWPYWLWCHSRPQPKTLSACGAVHIFAPCLLRQ